MDTSAIAGNDLWETIKNKEGETFYTKRGLPFTYSIRGRELFTDRRERSITESTFNNALLRLKADADAEGTLQRLNGPRALNMYGAPYVWAIFAGIGLIK
ncbi:MAG: hypothetical protein IJ608_06260 [Lachnospiraceae bacterium]|nr:hypothetical protein [Lachnospiraceae bacterium]